MKPALQVDDPIRREDLSFARMAVTHQNPNLAMALRFVAEMLVLKTGCLCEFLRSINDIA